MTNDDGSPRARLTLLSLPDEILERVFVCLYDSFQLVFADGKPPSMKFFLICQRLFPLVRRLWYGTLQLGDSKVLRDRRLGELPLQPPEVLAAVHTLDISFFEGDALPTYTICARLRHVRAILVNDGSYSQGASLNLMALQRLLYALPLLEEIVFGTYVDHLGALALPAALRRLRVEASALQDTLAHCVETLPLSFLKLYWAADAGEEELPALPWEYLETLVLVFRSTETSGVRQKLGEQVCVILRPQPREPSR